MMHTVSTGMWKEIASVDAVLSQPGGSASGKVSTSSPDVLRLQAAPLFVLLPSVSEIGTRFRQTENHNLS
jgi:hypothetical protein